MKFTQAGDDINNGIFAKLISDDGKVEMGIYPVMFGFRVRSGFVDDIMYEVDWCCGDMQERVEWVYSCLKAILESKESNNPFDDIRLRSDIKPLFNDGDFLMWLIERVSSLGEIEMIKLPSLAECKHRYVSHIWQEN